MVSKVSENLYLVGPASHMVEMRVEVAKETPYEKDILDLVQDPKEFLEDSIDSIEVNPTTNVSAGHGDQMTKNASVSKAYQQDPLKTGGLQQASRPGQNLYYKKVEAK